MFEKFLSHHWAVRVHEGREKGLWLKAVAVVESVQAAVVILDVTKVLSMFGPMQISTVHRFIKDGIRVSASIGSRIGSASMVLALKVMRACVKLDIRNISLEYSTQIDMVLCNCLSHIVRHSYPPESIP